jgi:hypothetical protein
LSIVGDAHPRKPFDHGKATVLHDYSVGLQASWESTSSGRMRAWRRRAAAVLRHRAAHKAAEILLGPKSPTSA